jgi:hypothetical protein
MAKTAKGKAFEVRKAKELKWYDQQKKKTKFILGVQRSSLTWRKNIKGFGDKKFKGHPITMAGYEAALKDYFKFVEELDENKPNYDLWQKYILMFEQVQAYYIKFGTSTEQVLKKQVNQFLKNLKEQIKKPTLPDRVGIPYPDKKYARIKSSFELQFFTTKTGD